MAEELEKMEAAEAAFDLVPSRLTAWNFARTSNDALRANVLSRQQFNANIANIIKVMREQEGKTELCSTSHIAR